MCKESLVSIRKPPDHRQFGTSNSRTHNNCSLSRRGQWNGKQQSGTALRYVACAPGSF